MPDPAAQHFIFVDYENVPAVDLVLVKGQPVHVTLLIGKKQTKLSTGLSVQLNEYAAQVRPIQVDVSGRNALDMILACHLGRAVEQHSRAKFTVVSKDKDFDPVVANLAAQGVNVARSDTFAAAFAPPAKASVAPKPAAAAATKLEKFVAHLRNSPPSTRMKLEHMITAFFQLPLPAGGMKGIIAELMKRKILTIDPKGKVTYH